MAKSIKLVDLEKQSSALLQAFSALPKTKQKPILQLLESVDVQLTKALSQSFSAWQAADLTDDDKAELEKLSAELEKLHAPFAVEISKATKKLSETMGKIDWTNPINALAESTKAQAAFQEASKDIAEREAEKVNDVNAKIEKLANPKAQAAREAFLKAFDYTEDIVVHEGTTRISLYNESTIIPLESVNHFAYDKKSARLFYNVDGPEGETWEQVFQYACTSRTSVVQLAYLLSTRSDDLPDGSKKLYTPTDKEAQEKTLQVINMGGLSGVKAGGVGTREKPKILPGFPKSFTLPD